ncbi:hypothetical protein CI109_102269 [Kwoniella shandongensis]|uniref:Uncharacterized protein n=1 Tax=Kwoniella shandongensis TaxID=1734106 RepID=A0A5M6BYN0_9TREE|nr:uncharacterized protein CI109_003577 [Kwoniella shandongensis]KAA5527924.1 hypothetical protein CI109_003577 [Kwoniella shandongensis]
MSRQNEASSSTSSQCSRTSSIPKKTNPEFTVSHLPDEGYELYDQDEDDHHVYESETGEDDDLTSPIIIPHASSFSSPSTLRKRRRKHEPRGIGGDLVGSMKRPMMDMKRGKRGNGRLKLLLGIAGTLFLLLTAVWLYRLNARAQSVGGWRNALSRFT